jgi:hypothetical protein
MRATAAALIAVSNIAQTAIQLKFSQLGLRSDNRYGALRTRFINVNNSREHAREL